MYCKYCGNQLANDSFVCLNCGCDPRKGNKFCNNCGIETNPEQVICIKCGVALKSQSYSSDDGKSVAMIAYLTLIGFIIALIQHGKNKTKLGAIHLRQVVGFMITSFALSIFYGLFALLFFEFYKMGFYWVIIGLFILVWLLLFITLIISFVNAVNGLEKPAPVFGKYYEKWLKNLFDSPEFVYNEHNTHNKKNIDSSITVNSLKVGSIFNILVLLLFTFSLFFPSFNLANTV